MRNDQNIALAERWHEANEIQHAIVLVLDASAGREPEGMSMDVTNRIRNARFAKKECGKLFNLLIATMCTRMTLTNRDESC